MRHSDKQGLRLRSNLFYILPFIGWGGLTFVFLFFVFSYIDFKPKVDENFFFSSDDPQLRTDRMISKIFSQESQIIVSAKGDIRSTDYLRKVSSLTSDLAAIPGVDTVQSLTHGPRSTQEALESPLWKRVLFSEDKKASFIYVFLKDKVSFEESVLKIERIKQRFHSPDFQLKISGAPYIVELIQRNLLHDLKVFSIVAFCVFGLSGLLISRSVAMVVGTLIACTTASTLTLISSHLFHIPIGPLTANLSTIVFVLTLTHMVFMTFNWQHIIQKKETSVEKASRLAVRVTLLPSFWSMLTALFGFLSLLFVPATPLRQLGASGAIGTVVAFLAAYVIYPSFLKIQTPRRLDNSKSTAESSNVSPFFKNRHGRIVTAILVATALASIGLWQLDTKPSLFSYFKKGSEIRDSLEYIDQNGGSVPLNIVVAHQDKRPFDFSHDYQRLWQLQDAMERDPSVGTVMSLTLLLAEAKRAPLASIVPVNWVLKLLEKPIFGKAAIYYITADQTQTLLVMKMKESYKRSDHMANVERLEKTVKDQGFQPVMIGGTYMLYGKLSSLVASSLIKGLPVLILLFAIMGGIISRSLKVMGAMIISLGCIPILMFGIFGHFHVVVDIVSAPGANIAIGIGVDAMIHTLIWIRRHPSGSMLSAAAWADVCSRLYKPILYSTTVVCAGFGIFILSGFPPTQRFGWSVVMGTLLSPLPALILVPWLATVKLRKSRLHVQ